MVSAHPKSRLVWGSFLAVVIGWLAAIVLLGSAYAFDYIHHHDEASWNRLWIMPLWFSVAIWIFALPVWLVVLLPLSLFLPASSALWRWPICTACGVIAGALVGSRISASRSRYRTADLVSLHTWCSCRRSYMFSGFPYSQTYGAATNHLTMRWSEPPPVVHLYFI